MRISLGAGKQGPFGSHIVWLFYKVNVSSIVDQLYKQHFAKMVISLAKYVGLQDLATSEDIVQEAFVEASVKWTQQLPQRPEAWLYTVCRNLAFKKIRDGKLRKTSSLYESDITVKLQIDRLFDDNDVDDQLKMLYACVHPDFAPKAQVIFALRYVAGFRIVQIATALGMQTEAVTKTLLRTRDAISQHGTPFPGLNLRMSSHKTPVVLKVLYLMFSEGYNSSHGKSLLNLELCEDALSLTQSVASSPALACPEAEGLLSLILFGLSRFEARFDADGDIMDLEHQDRSLWNADMTRVAAYHLGRAKESTYGTWHLEAAIAYVHSCAPSFEKTDWPKIVQIYNLILQSNDSPFTRLNQAIARFYAGEEDAAKSAMTSLGNSALMQRYHLYHIAMAKIHLGSDQSALARQHLKVALTLTSHDVERRFIKKMLERTAE